MPNSERIETLISPEALKQFETLKASADANTASFEKLIAKAVELNKAVGNATTFKEINKTTQEMTEHDKALAKQIDDLVKANAKLQAMYEQQAQKIKALNEEKKKQRDDEKKGVDDIVKAEERLKRANKDLGDSFANVGNNVVGLLGSTEEAFEKLIKLNDALKAVKNVQKELSSQKDTFAQMDQSLPEVQAGLKAILDREKELKAEEVLLKKNISDTNKEIKQRLNLNLITPGTRDEIKQTINELKRIRDFKIDINTEEGKAQIAEINQEIDRLSKIIEQTTDKLEKRKINIGNYGGAVKTLEAYLADVRNQLQETQKVADKGIKISAPSGPDSGNMRAATGPIRTNEAATRQLVSYNKATTDATQKVEDLRKKEELLSRIVESKVAGYASATSEIKSNEKALQALASAGLQSTEFYQALLKETAELKDNVGDLKDEIKALASDTRQFDLVAGAVTGLVNAFQVGASAAELFAGENEDVQKSIQRLVALQNISQGIQQIANDLTTKGTALNKLYNFIIGEGATAKTVNTTATTANTVATIANAEAQEAAATATTGLTVATKVLRGALIASGIGLLIAGIIYLVTKLQEWRDADINLIKHQAELNQVTLESIRLNKELADLTRTDFGTDIQALKNKVAANQAYGRSQGEVLAAEQALLKFQQEAATFKFFDTGGAGEAEKLKVELESAAKAYEEFIKAQANIDPSDRNEKTSAAQKELLTSNLELAKENYSSQKKIVDDYYNYNNEVIAKQLQIERLNADERRRYTLQSVTISANAIIDANERALQNEAATEKQRLALMQSTAEQQKRLARAQNEDVQNDPGASANERAMAARNLSYQINKIEKDSLEAQRKLREEYRRREREAIQEVFKIQLEDQIKAADLIANNEKKSFDQRTDALYQSYEKRRQLITANYEFELQQAIKNGAIAEERITIEKKALSDINQLTIDYGLEQQAIYQDNTDKVNEIIEKGQKARQDKIAGDAAATNTELIKQLVGGQITLEQYNKQREDAERNARIESLKEDVNNATAKVLATKEGTAARFEAEKELREKTLALNEEYNAKEIEAIVKLNDLKKQLATESVETFNSLVNSQFDAEAARIQQAMDDLDKQKEHDVLVANATIANKKEREEEVAKIELKAQLQREQLEKRQRQIELDRARFEKASNIAQIISSTALAIIEALKTYKGTPQAFAVAAAIGTIGALQLARALAAPLPKFAEGTTDAPGGLAWVGDGGKPELVITPQGKITQTPAVPTVMNVPKHSIVLPDARAALESGLAVNRHGRLVQNENQDIKEVGKKIDTLTKVMRNKPTLNMSADQGGLTAMWQYGANWVSYAEDQTRF